MSLLVGCPVILPPRPEVLASWNHRPHMVVVNIEEPAYGVPEADAWKQAIMAERSIDAYFPRRNLGVAASWNLIFENARTMGISHVALISQGVVLDGGTSRLASLVDEYADWRGILTDFAWHCIVLSVKLWEQLGPFDQAFTPAYFEDSDYVRRLFLSGLHTPDDRIPKVGRDLLDGTETVAAAMHLIPADTYGKNAERFRQKWGGDPFKETYTVPFDPASAAPTLNWSHAEHDHLGQSRTHNDH